MSLEERIKELLDDAAKPMPVRGEDFIELSRRIRALQLQPVERASWELIREDRDSR